MDMEHQLHHLLDFLPQDHLMASSGFFDVIGGGSGAHFQAGVFAEPAIGAAVGLEDGGAWVEDIMQLGDELFGAGAGGVNAGAADHQLPWQCDGGSPDDDQPPSMSFDADGSPPSVGEHGADGELASEPHHDDGNVSASRKRRDRSKTIVSERKRRVRMKEKLYELRSLVPNITKMDKASIIADALVYVKNLQAHARKLREEVAALEMRPASPGRQPQKQGRRAGVAGRRRNQRAAAPGGAGGDDDVGSAGGTRVMHVGAAQVGEGRFLVTVECERRDGVAAPLCAAAESLACFRVESSSLGRSGPDRVVSTLALKVCDHERHATIGEATVKLWVMAALLQEGFQPETTVGI